MIGHLRHHALHIAMCLPMFVIAGVFIASGASVAVLLPAVACVAMMTFMMWGMAVVGHHVHRRGKD
jgi:uncharacterized membrane protein YccC